MSEFEKQFEELLNFLKFDDFSILTKRIIDLTLDTEDIEWYKKTNNFLDWLDNNEHNDAKKEKYETLLWELHKVLIQKSIPEKQTIISTENLEKKYGSGFGLGPINFNLKQGEIVGLVGENGNGKTTLLRSLSGELNPTSGKINYNFPYQDLYDLRTQLVYIAQRTDTWYGGMYENLLFTASSYGYKPNEIELIVDLIISRLGLRKFKQHTWSSLSSGYKMRFELARMLLRKPKVLLIDEPLANLDILAQQTVLEDFRAIAKSPFRPIGIVLSSQQLYEVEKTSDEVIFLKAGKQKNLRENHQSDLEIKENQLVIEFESSLPQNVLGEIFKKLNLISLQFNGGTYIATFPEDKKVSQFLLLCIENNIELNYYRNISQSTRRFFVS